MRLAAAVLIAAAAFAQPSPTVDWRFGPAAIALEGGASIRIPSGAIHATRTETLRFLEATGNPPAGNEVVVFGPASLDWFAVVTWDSFESMGFVKANPDIEEIAAAIRRGSAAANSARQREGRETLDVIDWREKPAFDASTGRLEWGLDTVESGGRLVSNHFVYVLGRRGVLGVELVSNPAELRTHIAEWRRMLGSLEFPEEDRYRPPDTRIWLAALVAVIAAAALALLVLRQRGR
jgi:uncharacterized membrane-anchored protein